MLLLNWGVSRFRSGGGGSAECVCACHFCILWAVTGMVGGGIAPHNLKILGENGRRGNFCELAGMFYLSTGS
jgi:hypothetical protein